jgi:hypothetical protein
LLLLNVLRLCLRMLVDSKADRIMWRTEGVATDKVLLDTTSCRSDAWYYVRLVISLLYNCCFDRTIGTCVHIHIASIVNDERNGLMRQGHK